jgi:hypothetical protein
MHPFKAGWTDEVLNMARHGPDRTLPTSSAAVELHPNLH